MRQPMPEPCIKKTLPSPVYLVSSYFCSTNYHTLVSDSYESTLFRNCSNAAQAQPRLQVNYLNIRLLRAMWAGRVILGHDHFLSGICGRQSGTGTGFLSWVLQFSPTSIIPPIFHTNSFIFLNNQLDAQFFFMYVYFYSLHVSDIYVSIIRRINRLTPNGSYMGLTAPPTSKSCILYIYSTNTGTEYFKRALNSPFFLFKMQFVS